MSFLVFFVELLLEKLKSTQDVPFMCAWVLPIPKLSEIKESPFHFVRSVFITKRSGSVLKEPLRVLFSKTVLFETTLEPTWTVSVFKKSSFENNILQKKNSDKRFQFYIEKPNRLQDVAANWTGSVCFSISWEIETKDIEENSQKKAFKEINTSSSKMWLCGNFFQHWNNSLIEIP